MGERAVGAWVRTPGVRIRRPRGTWAEGPVGWRVEREQDVLVRRSGGSHSVVERRPVVAGVTRICRLEAGRRVLWRDRVPGCADPDPARTEPLHARKPLGPLSGLEEQRVVDK